MTYLVLKPTKGGIIRFKLYKKVAPLTCAAFIRTLPLRVKAVQARTAGEEIWIPKGPALKIPSENATSHLRPGELGIAPVQPRNKVAKSIAIVYGEATLHDCVNVFAKVLASDMSRLKKLGNAIWLGGSQVLKLEIK